MHSRILALTLTLAASTVGATTAPYEVWAFAVGRATDKEDLAELTEQAHAKPDFARVWFYGQVFDLVTVGIDDRLKERLRPQLQAIAEALAARDPADPAPLLLMDAIAHEGGAAFAEQVRGLEQRVEGAVRRGQNQPAQFAPAESLEAANAVFYRLLFRADLASDRMGGRAERKALVDTAQRVAEGFALAPGDLGPCARSSRGTGAARCRRPAVS